MAKIHASFCRCMSASLVECCVEYSDFVRMRGYKDFKIDLDGFASAIDIAAEALVQLCDGSRDNMDRAVLIAVAQFLEFENDDPLCGMESLINDAWKSLPIRGSDARLLLSRAWGNAY